MTGKRRFLALSVLAVSVALACVAYLIWSTRDGKPELAFRAYLTAAVGTAASIAAWLVTYAKYRLDRTKLRTDTFHAAMDRLFTSDADARADAVRALEPMMAYSTDHRSRILAAYTDLLRRRTADLTGNSLRHNLPSDVLAVLTALRRRHPAPTDPPLNLTGVRLLRAPMHAIDLTGAQLSDADLRSADLTDATLAEANLDHTTLTSANLTGASLRGTRLTHAKLVEATLTNCDLTHAALDHAALTGADLRGLDLRTTSGLTPDQIATATTDSSTRSPVRSH